MAIYNLLDSASASAFAALDAYPMTDTLDCVVRCVSTGGSGDFCGYMCG